MVCKELVGGVRWDGSFVEKSRLELFVDVWPWICKHFKDVIFDSVQHTVLLRKYFLNYFPCRIYLLRRLLFLEFIGDYCLPVITFFFMMLNQHKNEITNSTGTETFGLVTTQTCL